MIKMYPEIPSPGVGPASINNKNISAKTTEGPQKEDPKNINVFDNPPKIDLSNPDDVGNFLLETMKKCQEEKERALDNKG
ncbi:hypothetical protein IJG72_05205 [bacterium]|nr:hypothetical protein [bacterium]